MSSILYSSDNRLEDPQAAWRHHFYHPGIAIFGFHATSSLEATVAPRGPIPWTSTRVENLTQGPTILTTSSQPNPPRGSGMPIAGPAAVSRSTVQIYTRFKMFTSFSFSSPTPRTSILGPNKLNLLLVLLAVAGSSRAVFKNNFSDYPSGTHTCLNDASNSSNCQGDTSAEMNACLCSNGGDFVTNSAECIAAQDPGDLQATWVRIGSKSCKWTEGNRSKALGPGGAST